MNGMKTEETGSRKKYLAPLVVIMLCLVALTGAAYAYSSTLTVNNNSVEAKTLTLDLYGGSVSNTNVFTDEQIITFTDNYDYAKVNDAWTKTNDIKYQLKSPVTLVKYKLQVTGDTTFNTFTVSSADLATLQPFSAVKSQNTTAMSTLFTFTYNVGTTENGTDLVNGATLGQAGDAFEAITATAGGVTIWVSVIATAVSTAETILEPSVDATAQDPHNAAMYANAVKALTYGITIAASQA